jgi:hypothetical protein
MQEKIMKMTIELGMSISIAIAYEISTLLQCKFFNHASLYQHYYLLFVRAKVFTISSQRESIDHFVH